MGDFFQYDDDAQVISSISLRLIKEIFKEELEKFKKELIEEMEKIYCESWCIREE